MHQIAIVVTETIVVTVITIIAVMAMVDIQPPLATVPMAAHMEVHIATLIQVHGLEVDHPQGTGIVPVVRNIQNNTNFQIQISH